MAIVVRRPGDAGNFDRISEYLISGMDANAEIHPSTSQPLPRGDHLAISSRA